MLRDKSISEAAQKIIGERLSQVRKEKGYANYEHFCYEHGFPRSKYIGYENGANMRLDTLIHLLSALDISFVEFFDPINEAIAEIKSS